MEDNESLENLKQLFLKGRLNDAVCMAKKLLENLKYRNDAILILIRSLILQGHIVEAADECRKAIGSANENDAYVRLLYLWNARIQLDLSGDPTILINEARKTLNLASEGKYDQILLAQAQYFLGEGLAKAVHFGLMPHSGLLEAQYLLNRSFEVYLSLNENYEAIETLLVKSCIYSMGSHPDQFAAKSVAEEARRLAIKSNEFIGLAESELRLAELNIETTLASNSFNPNLKPDFDHFYRAKMLYEGNGSSLGVARTLLGLGRWQINYDLDGTSSLLEAAKIFEHEDCLIEINQVCSSLASWHGVHGNKLEEFHYHEEALKTATKAGNPLMIATANMAKADYYYRTGDYANAEGALKEAERSIKSPSVMALVALNVANTYFSMNLFDKAEEMCRRSITQLEPLGPSCNLSYAHLILGNVLLGKKKKCEAIGEWKLGQAVDEALYDRLNQADKLKSMGWALTLDESPCPEMPATYDKAMELFSRAILLIGPSNDNKSEIAIASVCQHATQTAINFGHFLDALSYLKLARGIYEKSMHVMNVAFVDTQIGLIYGALASPENTEYFDQAENAYSNAKNIFAKLGMLDIAWRLGFYLSDIARRKSWFELTAEAQRNRLVDAAHYLDESAKYIDFVRGKFIETDSLARQDSLLGLVSNKEQIYSAGIQLYYNYLKDNRGAFSWLERLKSRALLDMLSMTVLPQPPINDKKLLEEEARLIGLLQHTSSKVEALKLMDDLSLLWDQMGNDPAAREYLSLRHGLPVCWEDVPSLLKSNMDNSEVAERVVVIEYFIDGDSILIFIMRSDFKEPRIESKSLDYENLKNFLKSNFGEQNKVDAFVRDGPYGLEDMWHNYCDFLISPLSEWSNPGDIIYIVPHGLLHYLPFHALKIKDQYLIERNPVIYSPSASVLKFCQAKRNLNLNGLLARKTATVFGDSRDDLSMARGEAETVAQQFKIIPLLGRDVTRDNFIKAIDGADIVHFAGHGYFNSAQAMESGLLLANDERLTANDIFRLNTLKAYLVTLSGCETGISDARPGDELVGLSRAFLYAGTPSIIVTLWRVDDESAAFLMKKFYIYLQESNTSKVKALQRAILDTMKQPSWSSFYNWAPYVLIGDWR